jgi:MFS family permease
VDSEPSIAPLSRTGRMLVLATAFLGWMMAGTIMAIAPLAGRAATASFAPNASEGQIGEWFSRYVCAFLLGAAAGGLGFGWLGDRIGRAKAMAASILCYSLLTGCTYFAQTPVQYLTLHFLACLGVGGMWPNGVALVSEAWPNVSRPLLAGLIGASANLGLMLLAALAALPNMHITAENWRWVALVGATPIALGIFVDLFVPESPRWAANRISHPTQAHESPIAATFRSPILQLTLLGICLGAIPQMGNWGSANWTVPWAGQVGATHAPELKAWTQFNKSFGGALGALIGGWVASQFGRRSTYFVISLISLCISYYIFRFSNPRDPLFLYLVFAIGFSGTLYFGWLPLFLPELFPTHVRATGSGVSFNFGRILTAIGVLGTGQLMHFFAGDYARVGHVTCLIYVLGMIVIWFAPDTSKTQL